MKRQSILYILLLLLSLLICSGCGSSKESAKEQEAATEEAASGTEEAAVEEAAAPAEASEAETNVEDVVGVFEGLEDNHTAIFSFDGAETAFYFEDPAVQSVLYGAVMGSSYTLSYRPDESLGLNVIYKISE